ncbi:hypothetical protein RAC89_19130 [Paenibacillus sp. GD4]|uniref:hypothetical protein n=1 Tax=Paenibacillus sp. GD4 TaxID=3068890 RepID=UPI002796B3BA|nr:hypothetical protein [Paenibacillus sp. GD4]MDQ1912510.1 hypothetical protein [Paenibacillus sp. GD4]
MREVEFRRYLEQDNAITSKKKSVSSKVGKALIVERELRVDLDDIVKDDEKTYRLLLAVKEKLNDELYHGVYQNSVRRYYAFVNGKEFPTLKQFERSYKKAI